MTTNNSSKYIYMYISMCAFFFFAFVFGGGLVFGHFLFVCLSNTWSGWCLSPFSVKAVSSHMCLLACLQQLFPSDMHHWAYAEVLLYWVLCQAFTCRCLQLSWLRVDCFHLCRGTVSCEGSVESRCFREALGGTRAGSLIYSWLGAAWAAAASPFLPFCRH